MAGAVSQLSFAGDLCLGYSTFPLIYWTDRSFWQMKKKIKREIKVNETFLTKVGNNETDTGPGQFAINISQVIQLSAASFLTCHFRLRLKFWDDALIYKLHLGNLVFVDKRSRAFPKTQKFNL